MVGPVLRDAFSPGTAPPDGVFLQLVPSGGWRLWRGESAVQGFGSAAAP